MTTFCQNAARRNACRDGNGKKMIWCKITKDSCTSQRYCGEVEDYIVSEKAERFCKYYNKGNNE